MYRGKEPRERKSRLDPFRGGGGTSAFHLHPKRRNDLSNGYLVAGTRERMKKNLNHFATEICRQWKGEAKENAGGRSHFRQGERKHLAFRFP